MYAHTPQDARNVAPQTVASLSEIPSIREVAERSGVAYGTVYRVFEGRWPRRATAEKLAAGLGLTVDLFIRRLRAGRYKGLAQRTVNWDDWKPVEKRGADREADGSVEMEMRCRICGNRFPNVAGQLLGHQKTHALNGKRAMRREAKARRAGKKAAKAAAAA